MLTLIDNHNVHLRDELLKYHKDSDEVILCAPFISWNDVLFRFLSSDKKITIICRLAHPLTPDLLEKLYSYVTMNKRIYVYDNSSLHSKIYLFKKENVPFIGIVGSSNLTESGVNTNKEFNVCFEEKLGDVEKYLEYLKANCYEELNMETISYYRSFYVKPMINRRFKKAVIDSRLVEEYQDVLDKYEMVKAILCQYNNTDLPFTYVFDAFEHYFKVKMIRALNIEPFDTFNQGRFVEFFQLFLAEYFPEDDKEWRREKYQYNLNVKNRFDQLSAQEIRQFIFELHCIAWGSGSGNRKIELKKTDIAVLKELLKFLIEERMDMPQKYALALTPRKLFGFKVPYLGASAIGEIPGWLFPELYPIKNGKLLFIYKFFNI